MARSCPLSHAAPFAVPPDQIWQPSPNRRPIWLPTPSCDVPNSPTSPVETEAQTKRESRARQMQYAFIFSPQATRGPFVTPFLACQIPAQRSSTLRFATPLSRIIAPQEFVGPCVFPATPTGSLSVASQRPSERQRTSEASVRSSEVARIWAELCLSSRGARSRLRVAKVFFRRAPGNRFRQFRSDPPIFRLQADPSIRRLFEVVALTSFLSRGTYKAPDALPLFLVKHLANQLFGTH